MLFVITKGRSSVMYNYICSCKLKEKTEPCATAVLSGFLVEASCVYPVFTRTPMILSCKSGKAVCWAHKRRCSCTFYYSESLVPDVQDLIKVLALEEACIIGLGLMRHTSLKLGTADGMVIPFTPRSAGR